VTMAAGPCSPAGRDALSGPPDEAKVTVSLRD
jgi:hypothetical protein